MIIYTITHYIYINITSHKNLSKKIKKKMESRRISMALFVVIAIMVTILLTITPSSAQDGSENLGCWTNITNCMGTQEIIQCCPIIQQAIDDERNCFCLMRETVDQNATIASSFATIFSFCSISDSFQTLCPSGTYNLLINVYLYSYTSSVSW